MVYRVRCRHAAAARGSRIAGEACGRGDGMLVGFVDIFVEVVVFTCAEWNGRLRCTIRFVDVSEHKDQVYDRRLAVAGNATGSVIKLL